MSAASPEVPWQQLQPTVPGPAPGPGLEPGLAGPGPGPGHVPGPVPAHGLPVLELERELEHVRGQLGPGPGPEPGPEPGPGLGPVLELEPELELELGLELELVLGPELEQRQQRAVEMGTFAAVEVELFAWGFGESKRRKKHGEW